MGCTLREEMAELTPRWSKRGYDLDFGAGIALGYATCGEVGFEGRSDYAAIGAVMNLASRLADEATGGQILIAQRLYAEVEKDVEVEPGGQYTLKGFQRPVVAFNVVAVRENLQSCLRSRPSLNSQTRCTQSVSAHCSRGRHAAPGPTIPKRPRRHWSSLSICPEEMSVCRGIVVFLTTDGLDRARTSRATARTCWGSYEPAVVVDSGACSNLDGTKRSTLEPSTTGRASPSNGFACESGRSGVGCTRSQTPPWLPPGRRAECRHSGPAVCEGTNAGSRRTRRRRSGTRHADPCVLDTGGLVYARPQRRSSLSAGRLRRLPVSRRGVRSAGLIVHECDATARTAPNTTTGVLDCEHPRRGNPGTTSGSASPQPSV